MFLKPELIKEVYSYRLKKSKAHIRVYREVLRYPVKLENESENLELFDDSITD